MNEERRARYQGWAERARVREGRREEVAAAGRRAQANRSQIEPVAAELGLPWALVAALQELEASGRMDRHVANGDKLTGRTHHDPAGLPRGGNPPFTWEEAAREELAEVRRPEGGAWTLVDLMYAAESFNGFGYEKHGKPSPYVVAGTTVEEAGRYVRDHVYDPDAWSSQVGALALWLELVEMGVDVTAV